MGEELDRMEALAMSISDGEAVDWESVERSSPDEERRQVIHFLRVVAEIAQGRDWDAPALEPAAGSDRAPDVASGAAMKS